MVSLMAYGIFSNILWAVHELYGTLIQYSRILEMMIWHNENKQKTVLADQRLILRMRKSHKPNDAMKMANKENK